MATRTARARTVRSFVIREGRITHAQTRALRELWPLYGVEFEDLRQSAAEAFSRFAPLHLEIGIGNGENLLSIAAAAPGNNYLGCDVHRPGLGHALIGLRSGRLHNVRLIACDAVDLVGVLPPETLDRVYVFFPDPWPKKRHHKRRLLQPAFLDHLAHRVRRSGQIHFASDNAGYAQSVLEAIEHSPRWLNLAGPGRWAPRPRYRVVTRFERRAMKEHRPIFEIAAAKLDG